MWWNDSDIRFIIILIFLLILLLIMKLNKKNKKAINSEEYIEYVKFLGNLESEDDNYDKKINTIIKLINNKKITDIKEISRISGCSYDEIILKIKFLKKQKIIGNYFIDVKNGILNPCSMEDKKLIQKYSKFIYNKHLQPEYIAKYMPNCTIDNLEEIKKQILKDLSYLDNKNLLNGINIDLVDEKIIYYDLEKIKNQKDYISLECENCGALNEVPRQGKVRCEYCKTIIEDKSINN